MNLWRVAEGVRLGPLDDRDRFMRFLERNPGLSVAVRDGRTLVGAVLCGHDGRIGYLHHVAVAASHRRRGIGRKMVERCLVGLRKAGIDSAYAFVMEANRPGHEFWQALGWRRRDVDTMCLDTLTPAGGSR
jgi:ribosomal protein S18 acetylase RimI-like enzyme